MIIIPPCVNCEHLKRNNKKKGFQCSLLYPEKVPGEILLAKVDCPSYKEERKRKE